MQPSPKLGADLPAQLRDFLAQFRAQLGEPLLQLGVEAREIQLVQLAQIDNTLSKEVGDTLTIRLARRSIKY
jgi:hypothetical protein